MHSLHNVLKKGMDLEDRVCLSVCPSIFEVQNRWMNFDKTGYTIGVTLNSNLVIFLVGSNDVEGARSCEMGEKLVPFQNVLTIVTNSNLRTSVKL
jgi:hypothetical protein